jgi:hypothetical protein
VSGRPVLRSALALALLAGSLAGALPAAGQGAGTQPPGAPAATNVLRSVYFAAASVSDGLAAEAAVLINSLPEMLATALSARQPFTRAALPARARSVVSVAAAAAADGSLTVTVGLRDARAGTDSLARTFGPGGIDSAGFVALVDDAASRLAPQLGPVPPEVDVLAVTSQKELVVAAQESDYLDTLDKRFAFTLWGSGLLRLLDSTGVADQPFYALGLTPLIIEAAWFPWRNVGFLASFSFAVNGNFDYGHHVRDNATGYFFFPGIGITYRTLGQVSAEYAMTFSVGEIYLVADQGDVIDMYGDVGLALGSSAWSSPAFRLRIAPSLAWNITPSFALKTSLGFDFILPPMFSWQYDSPLGAFQFLGLGVAWRP